MAALLALITDIHGLGLQAAQGLLLTTSFYCGHGRQNPGVVEALFRPG